MDNSIDVMPPMPQDKKTAEEAIEQEIQEGQWMPVGFDTELEKDGEKWTLGSQSNMWDSGEPRQYNSNNGVLIITNQSGRYFITRASAEKYELLEKAGFKKSNIAVPFSNGEVPADPEARKQFDALWPEPKE